MCPFKVINSAVSNNNVRAFLEHCQHLFHLADHEFHLEIDKS